MSETLPIATRAEVRAYARRMTLRHPRALAAALALHALAALTGLASPWLLGDLVEGVRDGHAHVGTTVLTIGGFVLAQSVLVRYAHLLSTRLGERVLADLREEFVGRVLRLPLATVERAGTGDLFSRASRDVDALGRVVREGVPQTLIALVTMVFTLGALLLAGPLFLLPCLVMVPLLVLSTRWYLARAVDGYLRENAAWAHLTDGLAETVAGARTVQALRLAGRRHRRGDDDIRRSWAAERYTLRLRLVYFPLVEVAYVIPVAATLLTGGLLYDRGLASLAEVTAATLYVQQLIQPIDVLLSWLDVLQISGASLARLLGVAAEPRTAGTLRAPEGGPLTVTGLCYAYRDGHDVLHDIDLELRPGERIAVVGPSGAGKSTLGRLLAGIYAPRTGSVAVGGVPLTGLSDEDLRRQVALVTQENHVFSGTLAENLALARPGASESELREALTAVDAWDWASALGLGTRVGSGGPTLSPAQAQQLALARLVLADPRTLILDEATAELDPRAARHLERSLAAVLKGRTVVAIAHRLHTAHDADRVAVVEDGRITELGTHDELVANGGSYAALWRTWHGA